MSLAQTSRESGLYLGAVRDIADTLGLKRKDGPVRTYTPDAIAKVYRSLGSVPETGERLGVSLATVYRALRELGLVQTDADQRRAEHIARLVKATRMRDGGISMAAIANKFGVARSTVLRWFD